MTTVAPRWTRLGHDERRDQILKQASKLFSRTSYAAVSMEDIAAAAGVTRGLLNHYFGTKRELYLDVVRSITKLPPRVQRGAAGESLADVVAHNVRLYLDNVERNRMAWLAAAGGVGFGRDRELEHILHEAEEAYVDRVIEVFGRDPRTAPDAQRAVLRAYGAMAQTVSREWLAAQRLTREQAHVLLCDVLLRLTGGLTDKVVAA